MSLELPSLLRSDALARSMAQEYRQKEQRHYDYDMPHSTILTTMIRGGLSANTVPAHCEFDFEFRHLPWTDPDRLETEVRSFADQLLKLEMSRESSDCAVEFETRCSYPAFESMANPQEGLDAASSHLLDMLGLAQVPLSYASFGTEATWFRQAGIPTVVCGPGSIAQAHQPDEFVTLEQMSDCERLLSRLLTAMTCDGTPTPSSAAADARRIGRRRATRGGP